MTRADCCRRPQACPARANGDCDYQPPPVAVDVDDALAVVLEALYGPAWLDHVTAAATNRGDS